MKNRLYPYRVDHRRQADCGLVRILEARLDSPLLLRSIHSLLSSPLLLILSLVLTLLMILI